MIQLAGGGGGVLTYCLPSSPFTIDAADLSTRDIVLTANIRHKQQHKVRRRAGMWAGAVMTMEAAGLPALALCSLPSPRVRHAMSPPEQHHRG